MYIAKHFLGRAIPAASEKTIENTINFLMISIYLIKSNNLDASSLLYCGLALSSVFLVGYAGKNAGEITAKKLIHISKSTYAFFNQTESKANLLQKTALSTSVPATQGMIKY